MTQELPRWLGAAPDVSDETRAAALPRHSAGHRRCAGVAALRVALAAAAGACLPFAAHGQEHFGLYEAARFESTTGAAVKREPKAAFWYFANDTIAIPADSPPPSLDSGEEPTDADIRQWIGRAAPGREALPFLVWSGAPAVESGVQLGPGGRTVQLASGQALAFDVVPKLASNLSYYNASSVAFFAARTLRMRGQVEAGGSMPRFVARTLWPEDWRIGPRSPQPLAPGETVGTLVEAEGGGAAAPFSTRVLWARDPAPSASAAKRAVIALVLSGAQGDDDEAHGGHFAIATGWLGPDGRFADWMANNFYNLGTQSEKGIIASMLPMDSYLADLNSGQSWYRPAYIVAAVLDDPAPAHAIQEALVRVFMRFYRHHIEYDHARANCAGISVDTLAGLGWNGPRLGPTSTWKAAAGYFYSSATDASFASGRKTFAYLTEDRARLYPRAAFDTFAQDLLDLAAAPQRPKTDFERTLAATLRSVVFVRIPQIPSSRAMGTYPVGTFDDYMRRVPADRKDWKIVPAPPREFPAALRDRPPAEPVLSDTTTGVLATGGLLALVALAGKLVFARIRRIRTRRPA